MIQQFRLWIGLMVIAVLAACTSVAPVSAPPAATPIADAMASETEATTPRTSLAEEEARATTPAQAERLIADFDGASETDGDILYLFGEVLDVNGDAVPNARVEIWQTDASGVYDHPGDPGTANRDQSFQFYGSTSTDTDGWYAFRTIAPGRYEPRPRHIHYKVKQDGESLLTSQFYFSDDIAVVKDESMFRAVGESGDLLLIQLVQGEDGLLANGQIVVDTGIEAGTLSLTPSQAEGPYYPVVPLADYDNDLTRLP